MLFILKSKLEVCKKHFSKIIPYYNQQVCVNLVNHHGSEGLLGKAYEQTISLMNDSLIKFKAFLIIPCLFYQNFTELLHI